MSPAEVKALAPGELSALAEKTRERILEVVSERGGHLASSLGAVELCIALLRVFDPPRDKVVWDVGHQAYAWKLLTDRWDSFATLRTRGGVSGFPDPGESPFDSFVAGHAGAALSAAEGMAAARDLAGGSENVVAVVGDASLTNGMNLEALNNCAAVTKKLVLVLNDNAMSISANVGSFARVLGRMLAGVKYNRMKAKAESAGHRLRLSFLSLSPVAVGPGVGAAARVRQLGGALHDGGGHGGHGLVVRLRLRLALRLPGGHGRRGGTHVQLRQGLHGGAVALLGGALQPEHGVQGILIDLGLVLGLLQQTPVMLGQVILGDHVALVCLLQQFFRVHDAPPPQVSVSGFDESRRKKFLYCQIILHGEAKSRNGGPFLPKVRPAGGITAPPSAQWPPPGIRIRRTGPATPR